MAKDNKSLGQKINYRGDSDNKNAVKSTDGTGHEFDYQPSSKKDRSARRTVSERFREMRDDSIRKEAEEQWELGRKMYRMWSPERDADDWGADIVLPDGFSAIQTHMQETIDARFRPIIEGTESSDDVLANFNDAIFQHSMDVTEFDAETTKARRAAAMMGTAFTREEYRYETREIEDPTSFESGEIKYTKKEILDWDDVYTRYVRPENCFFDPGAEDQKYANDCIYREVMSFDEFKIVYDGKPGFKDIDKVVPAGSLSDDIQFFDMGDDMEDNDVELLHYENRLTDSYDVLANNVLVRSDPLPNKHKELSLDVWTFYPLEGQIYGMGIPKIINTLVQERQTNRNQRIDRGTLQNHKMFLVNDLFSIDEDDAAPRPHGMIEVNTNGLPLRDAIMPLEYGDIPISSIRMDSELLADERQAHGMQESSSLQPGTTATQAAIIKESTQRRINLINTLTMWNTLIRLGKKKWSNVQFFYPAEREERIMRDNKWEIKKEFRQIKTDGVKFSLYGSGEEDDPVDIQMEEVPGRHKLRLDPTYARYMGNDLDVTVDAAAMAIVSQAIKRQETNELFDRVMNNPMTARFTDGQKAFKRMLIVNNEDPSDWMPGAGETDEEMKMLAENENELFIDMEASGKIFQLPGTPKATEAHTQVHLQFTQTQSFRDLSEPVQRALSNHILEENENNPNVPNLGEEGPGLEGDPAVAGATGGDVIPPGLPGGPLPGDGLGALAGAPIAGGDVTNGQGPAPPVA